MFVFLYTVFVNVMLSTFLEEDARPFVVLQQNMCYYISYNEKKSFLAIAEMKAEYLA